MVKRRDLGKDKCVIGWWEEGWPMGSPSQNLTQLA